MLGMYYKYYQTSIEKQQAVINIQQTSIKTLSVTNVIKAIRSYKVKLVFGVQPFALAMMRQAQVHVKGLEVHESCSVIRAIFCRTFGSMEMFYAREDIS